MCDVKSPDDEPSGFIIIVSLRYNKRLPFNFLPIMVEIAANIYLIFFFNESHERASYFQYNNDKYSL